MLITGLLAFAALCAFAIALVAFIALFVPIARIGLRSRSRSAVVLAGSLLSGFLLATALPPAPTDPPHRVTERLPEWPDGWHVTGYYAPIINLEIDLGGERRDGSVYERASTAVADLAQLVTANQLPRQGRIEAINVTFLGPAGDDIAVGRKVMHATYLTDDLRRAETIGHTPEQLLGDYHEAGFWAPWNDDILVAFCDDHTGSQFCREVGPHR